MTTAFTLSTGLLPPLITSMSSLPGNGIMHQINLGANVSGESTPRRWSSPFPDTCSGYRQPYPSCRCTRCYRHRCWWISKRKPSCSAAPSHDAPTGYHWCRTLPVRRQPGITATDIVLSHYRVSARTAKVVSAYLEFFGEGADGAHHWATALPSQI